MANNDVEDLSNERFKIKTITDTLRPWELLAFKSLIRDFMFDVIGEIELTRYLRLLFGLEEDNLSDPKIDDEKPKEDVTNVFAKIDSQKLRELLKAIEESLSPSEMTSYKSLCGDFKSHKIGFSRFFTNLLGLIEKDEHLHQSFVEFAYGPDQENQEDVVVRVGETTNQDDVEEGEIREDNLSDHPKIGTRRNLRRRVINVTPSYILIPEEEQSPVTNRVLNNKTYASVPNLRPREKKVTRNEKRMKQCEDDMYETDMLMGYLESAVNKAEKVISGEMSIEDIGYHFYRCAERLYGEDMFDIVREDHQRALPVILIRLKQKLREVTDAQRSWKPVWKQYIERISAEQRDSIAKKTQEKVKKTTV